MKYFLAIFLSLLGSVAMADSGIRRTPCGYQQITSVDSGAALTIPAACGGNPTEVLVKAESQAVRYRDDGTAPTSSVGMPLAVGEPGLLYQGTISALQFISQVNGAKLDILFYK